jgi:tol-pal system protein YbgF
MMRQILTGVMTVICVSWLASAPAKAQDAASNQAAIFQMQEQVRQLNGRVEELTFQILELQELLRQSREDAEARFLDLEEGRQGSVAPNDPILDTSPNTGVANTPTLDNGVIDGTRQPLGPGTPPRALGTLTFDENGNLVEGALGRPLDLNQLNAPNRAPSTNPSIDTAQQDGVVNGADVASIDDSDADEGPLPADLPSANDLYQQGYTEVLAGNYASAEVTFRQLLRAYPNHDRAANARYWLGESLFAQGDFNDAADAYISVINDHADTDLAPDAMLKLGVALVGMGENSVACETFAAVAERYPATPALFKQRLDREKRSASCG